MSLHGLYIMQAYQQKAEIIRNERLTGDIFRITFVAPDIAAGSRPGQFVMVRTGEGMDPLLRRPFSVHQVAAGGLVQILFKIIGKGTRLLSRRQPGEELDVLGPLGRGFSLASDGQHSLVGGGIGIAPLLFLAKQLLKKNEPAAVKVLLGARTREEIDTLVDDFQSLGVEVHTITEDGSLGGPGMVTDLMSKEIYATPGMVYACGPYPMLRAVAAVCREKGWECQVSLETVMACGLAACLGCAMSRADMNGYIHVCKDGPVFKTDEVAWL